MFKKCYLVPLVVVIFVILLWYVGNSLVTAMRMDKVNFIISDYIGKRESGLTQGRLIEYVNACGCTVDKSETHLIIKLRFIWTRKSWIVPIENS